MLRFLHGNAADLSHSYSTKKGPWLCSPVCKCVVRRLFLPFDKCQLCFNIGPEGESDCLTSSRKFKKKKTKLRSPPLTSGREEGR